MNWPGIIKHADDDELTYVSDQSAWDNDVDLHYTDYDESDYLVDASGNTYSLMKRLSNLVTPEPRGESKTLQDVLALTKAHAAQKGSCCVAKLYAPDIKEAFKIVESLNEA